GRAADLHAHLQGAAQGHRARVLLRDGHVAGAAGRAAHAGAARAGRDLRRAAARDARRAARATKRTVTVMTTETQTPSEARFTVAAIQMTSTRDVQRNLAAARALLEEAAAAGAKLAVLPENFSFLGAQDSDRLAAAEPPGDGPAQRFLAQAA